MEKFDIIILGSGISSLSFAHYCANDGLRVLVLEKENRIGGAFHSHNFGSDFDNFWLELGAHTCYNSYGGLIDILEAQGLTGKILKREKVPFRFYENGALCSIFSKLDLPELLLSAPRIFFSNKTGETVESYYKKIVGKRNYRSVFEAAFNAVPSQPAGNFPAEMLFKKRPRRKEIVRSYTFKNGLQSVTDTIAASGVISVRRGFEADAIDFSEGLFRIRGKNGDSFDARFVALGTPAAESARLTASFNPELSAALAKIKTIKVESAGVVVKKTDISLPQIAGIISGDSLFYSVVSRDTVPDDNYRGFTFHFRPEAIGDDVKLKQMREVLQSEIDPRKNYVSKVNVMPAFSPEHHSHLSSINKIAGKGNLFLCGNYFNGMAIEDCINRSRDEYGRLNRIL